MTEVHKAARGAVHTLLFIGLIGSLLIGLVAYVAMLAGFELPFIGLVSIDEVIGAVIVAIVLTLLLSLYVARRQSFGDREAGG